MNDHKDNKLREIANYIKASEKSLNKAYKLLEALSRDSNRFDDVPGILGVFDGESMVTIDGKSFEVNPNYAAKSLLVVGDSLKMVEEGGKNFFKQVTKVPRKKLKGVLNKKEGDWYALTDSGSFRVSNVSVEFNRGEKNDEIEVLVPENNLNAPFAAIERFLVEREKDAVKPSETVKPVEKPVEKVVAKPVEKKEEKKVEKTKPSERNREVGAKPKAKVTEKVVEKKAEEKVEKKTEKKIESIVEDDDLR